MKNDRAEQNKMIAAIENAKSKADVKSVLKEFSEVNSGTALCIAFEKLYVDLNTGFSPEVPVSDLMLLHKDFKTTNGMSWCRSDSSYLGKKYNIERVQAHGSTYSIRMDGFKKAIQAGAIRKDIRETIKSRRCAILDVKSIIECDHKDGIKNDLSVADVNQQKLSDFQALSKAANDAKRQHCKKCRDTGVRYDATNLGYAVPYTHGTKSSKSCIGCYWYDPKQFNKEISESFEKKD